jgi:hypothetical protein
VRREDDVRRLPERARLRQWFLGEDIERSTAKAIREERFSERLLVDDPSTRDDDHHRVVLHARERGAIEEALRVRGERERDDDVIGDL